MDIWMFFGLQKDANLCHVEFADWQWEIHPMDECLKTIAEWPQKSHKKTWGPADFPAIQRWIMNWIMDTMDLWISMDNYGYYGRIMVRII